MADFSLPAFYPDTLFDPSQNSNQFSAYNNQALPWPSTYVGWPTDSMGRPIQPQPGMTLNSAPGATAAYPASVAPDMSQQFGGAVANMINQAQNMSPAAKLSVMANALPGGNNPTNAAYASQLLGQQQQQQAQQAAQSSYGGGLSAESYLQLLAHPNYVQTPGATVPQASASSQPSNSVLQQFLSNWKPAQSGPGSGFAKGFAAGLTGAGGS